MIHFLIIKCDFLLINPIKLISNALNLSISKQMTSKANPKNQLIQSQITCMEAKRKSVSKSSESNNIFSRNKNFNKEEVFLKRKEIIFLNQKLTINIPKIRKLKVPNL